MAGKEKEKGERAAIYMPTRGENLRAQNIGESTAREARQAAYEIFLGFHSGRPQRTFPLLNPQNLSFLLSADFIAFLLFSPLLSARKRNGGEKLLEGVEGMEVVRVGSLVMAVLALVLALGIPSSVNGQSSSPAPAPAPASDGVAVDQGIAYVLMAVALVLTYIIH